MSSVVNLTPTGELRFVRINSSISDERVPTMTCGIHRYKLQQKWLGTDDVIRWMDVEIDHDPVFITKSSPQEAEVRCNCAGTAPTMPTFRTEHLSTCQCSTANRGQDL